MLCLLHPAAKSTIVPLSNPNGGDRRSNRISRLCRREVFIFNHVDSYGSQGSVQSKHRIGIAEDGLWTLELARFRCGAVPHLSWGLPPSGFRPDPILSDLIPAVGGLIPLF